MPAPIARNLFAAVAVAASLLVSGLPARAASCPPGIVCAPAWTPPPVSYGSVHAPYTDAHGWTDHCGGAHDVNVNGGSTYYPDGVTDAGNNGQPGYCGYYQAAVGAMSSLSPILTVLLPVLLLALAIWQGPRIIKSLALRGAK